MRLPNLWSWLNSGQPRPVPRQRRAERFRPALAKLEDRTVPSNFIATGAGPGGLPLVSIRMDIRDLFNGNPPNSAGQVPAPTSDGKTDITSQLFYAYNPSFRGGVRVTTGNFDGDPTTPDSIVTGTGPGGGPHIIVWRTQQAPDGQVTTTGVVDQFFAYDPRFAGGVNLTTGDLDGDGRAELIIAPSGGGGPHVKIYSQGADGRFQVRHQFMAFDPRFSGGVNVSSSQGYATPVQIRQVISAQLPAAQNSDPGTNFAVVPYGTDDSTTPGNFPQQYIPLIGSDFPTLSDFGVTGNTLPTGFGASPNFPDPAFQPLGSVFFPYATVGSGFIQYLSGNLLNSYLQIAYEPNVFDPQRANPPFTQPLVFASWADMDMNRPAFADPDVVYGPFVNTAPQQGMAPPAVTPLTAPFAQVNTRNQLIIGAGPGGGPHVKVMDFVNDAQGFRLNEELGFMAFDVSFSGGVNVALGDVLQFPLPSFDAQGNPVIFPDTVSTVLEARTFPFTVNDIYRQFTPEIIVTQATGGTLARVFADYNPTLAQRMSIAEIDLQPALLATKNVFDFGNPLGGFLTMQDVTTFDFAIDPQFKGTIHPAVAGLDFSGIPGDSGINALGQNVFAAGPNPGNPPNRGARVRIFENIGPLQFPTPPLPGGTFQIQMPVDDFQAFSIGDFPGGAGGVAFGFGRLPRPTLDVIDLPPIAVQTITNPRLV